MIWVRLGPEDGDPTTFLRSLVAAVQRHHPGFGFEAVTGPAGDPPGWPARFAGLATTLAEAARPCSAPWWSRCWRRTGPAS